MRKKKKTIACIIDLAEIITQIVMVVILEVGQKI